MFNVENRTGNTHTTVLKLALPPGAAYAVLQDGKALALQNTDDWDYPSRVDLSMKGPTTKVEIVRR
jgi:hypothetical protein